MAVSFFFFPQFIFFFFVVFSVILFSLWNAFRLNFAKAHYVNLTVIFSFFFFIISSALVFYTWNLPSHFVVLYSGLRFDFWVYWFSLFILVLFSFFLAIFLVNYRYLRDVEPEYLFLCVGIVLSSLLLVASNDFLLLFLAIEAQALVLFFLIILDPNCKKSTEAAWKYFMLNGFGTSLLALSTALIFYSGNSIAFDELLSSSTIERHGWPMWAGFGCFILGMSMKIGVAPFHMWLPDIFEGTPSLSLFFVGIISKVSQFGILFYIFSGISDIFSTVFLLLGLVSVAFGSVQMVFQFNVKRQLAYFSVYSSGIVFLFLAHISDFYWFFFVMYLFFSNWFLFLYVFFLFTLRDSRGLPLLRDTASFSKLLKTSPFIAYSLVIIFVSLLGLPPLVGFFPKFFFLRLISTQLSVFYLFVFLVSTLIVIFPFVVLVKEMFFEIRKKGGGVAISPFGFYNSLFFLVMFLISILFLFWFSEPFLVSLFNHQLS